jgi:molybdopterin molybdotransferase
VRAARGGAPRRLRGSSVVAPLLPIDEARAAVLAHIGPLGAEEVAVAGARNRVLAEDVAAAGDVPPFANSAMDGFLVSAGPAQRRLRIVGESRAGAPATKPPGEEEALRISTGALVPPGDGLGVLPVEHATEQDGHVTTNADTAPGQHVRHAGEDIRAGTTVLSRGAPLSAAALGVAVVCGRATLRCARRPRVVVLSTGDELSAPGEPLGPGQIHNSNGVTLAALAAQAGADVTTHGAVQDTEAAARAAIEQALDATDVLLLSGGVSVGPHDHVKPALDALGVTERFWRVALQPGKPTWFGTKEDTLVFGLPGNPVSAVVTFLLFARPAIAALQGRDPGAPRVTARLTTAIERHAGRDRAVRVRLTEDGDARTATPTGPQGSHQLTSMLHADGLAIVPAGDGALAEGERVTVERI